MRTGLIGLIAAAVTAWPLAVSAQQSLFAQPAANEPAEAAAPAAKPRPKPKPRGPVPARALQISNASESTLEALEVAGDGKTARIAKPIPPQGRTVLKLPVLKRCTVTVTATLEGSPAPEAADHDICKDKTIRITD